MKFCQTLTKVTVFSKALAIILFILLPFAAFYLGIKYQKVLDSPLQKDTSSKIHSAPISTVVVDWRSGEVIPTPKMKLYLDKLDGIYFEYPSDWLSSQEDPASFHIQSPDLKRGDDGAIVKGQNLDFYVMSTDASGVDESGFPNIQPGPLLPAEKLLETKWLTVDGYRAKQEIYDIKAKLIIDNDEKEGRFYYFDMTYSAGSSSSLDIFNEITSTIKFLDHLNSPPRR